MTRLKGRKIALVVGLFASILHVLWAILVALGMGQKYLSLVFPLHFINNLYTVMPFNLLNAVLLVVFAFIGSYIAALFFVWLWNTVKIN